MNRLLGRDGKTAPAPADADIRHALLTSAVISYGRLLCPTRSSASVPGHLPARFVSELSREHRSVHRRLLQLRDQEFAHSDAAVADVKVSASMALGGILLPESRLLRRCSLSDRDLAVLDEILSRIHVYLYDEMIRLYPVLAPHGRF